MSKKYEQLIAKAISTESDAEALACFRKAMSFRPKETTVDMSYIRMFGQDQSIEDWQELIRNLYVTNTKLESSLDTLKRNAIQDTGQVDDTPSILSPWQRFAIGLIIGMSLGYLFLT